MVQKFKFLFAALEAVGHLNSAIGIGQQLLSRGHVVIFATPITWKGKFKSLGFIEEYYQTEDEESKNDEKFGEILASVASALALSPIQKIEPLNKIIFEEIVRTVMDSHERLKELVHIVNPDVIFVDNVVHVPALMNQGIPWILSNSVNPLFTLNSDLKHLPPGVSGHSIFAPDQNAWIQFIDKTSEVYRDTFQHFKTWVVDNGGPELKTKPSTFWLESSPFANIYMYPEEMSYEMHLPATTDRRTWHRFDAFVREELGQFEIPAKLRNLPGKLIYFSLGSIGCSELGLMRKLIGILAKSPNRFIIAKGPLGDQLELSDNMWGANSLPQTLVLPLVDLVITHGGNNTVTETFYFGKPLLVLPLFLDQLDNGTRIHETGHGLQFDPCHVTEDELLNGIDTLLNDELLRKRMHSIGLRIRASNSQSRAADIVENVARNNT